MSRTMAKCVGLKLQESTSKKISTLNADYTKAKEVCQEEGKNEEEEQEQCEEESQCKPI